MGLASYPGPPRLLSLAWGGLGTRLPWDVHYWLCAVLDPAEQVRETFPACYTAQKYEFILPLWRFLQKVGAKRLLNSL